jgi:hypothetical protein
VQLLTQACGHALADDDDALPDGVACRSLLAAFWRQVAFDLSRGRAEAIAFLHGPDFEGWVTLCFSSVTPEQLRDQMLALADGKSKRRFAPRRTGRRRASKGKD